MARRNLLRVLAILCAGLCLSASGGGVPRPFTITGAVQFHGSWDPSWTPDPRLDVSPSVCQIDRTRGDYAQGPVWTSFSLTVSFPATVDGVSKTMTLWIRLLDFHGTGVYTFGTVELYQASRRGDIWAGTPGHADVVTVTLASGADSPGKDATVAGTLDVDASDGAGEGTSVLISGDWSCALRPADNGQVVGQK